MTRDRFSQTARCLSTLLENTPPCEIIAVIGGAPGSFKKEWASVFGSKVRFVFESEFLSPSRSRNIGLRAVKTPLAVVMDNDVFVRPGWLEPLVSCQKETGAAMMVPLILEAEKRIHAAGNDLYVTYENGRAYASKVLRCFQQAFAENSNLERRPTDYGEQHCQLLDVQTALELQVFDENLQCSSEVDSGLTWAKAGCSMWFEPRSVVRFAIGYRVEDPRDIPLFVRRWDMRAHRKDHGYLMKKWNMDLSEYGHYKDFLAESNAKLGLVPRVMPCRFSLWLDHRLMNARSVFGKFLALWRRLKAKLYGYGDWEKEIPG